MRRRRLLLVILLVVVLVPLLAALGVGAYLRSGGLEAMLSQRWSDRGLPGTLSVRQMRFVSLDEVVVEGLSLGESGRPPLATATRAVARLDLVQGQLTHLRVEDVEGELDAERLRYLIAVVDAEGRRAPQGPPHRVQVEVQGQVRLPGGMLVSEASVAVDATGKNATVAARALLDGAPLELAITTRSLPGIGPPEVQVEVREGRAQPARALAALAALELLKPAPAWVPPLLPAQADLVGTTVVIDNGAHTVRGQAKATWAGGELTATIDVDHRQLRFHQGRVRDERFGMVQGTLTVAHLDQAIAFDADSWSLAPAVALPVPLPAAEIARLLPQLSLRHPTSDGRTQVALAGGEGARVEALVGGDTAPRIRGQNIPLALVQPLLPQPLMLAGGQVRSLEVAIHERRPEITAELSQARLLAQGWSLGPLDGRIAAVTLPTGGAQVQVVLSRAEASQGTIGTIGFTGDAHKGSLSVSCPGVESLLLRLRGPAVLPDLRGGLDLHLSYQHGEAGLDLAIDRARLTRTELRLGGGELLREVTTDLRGTIQVRPEAVVVRAGGQLRTGELFVSPSWLPLAAQTPIGSVEVRILPGAVVELAEVLVRAADAQGQPLPGGYSCQFSGRLAGDPVTGQVQGVIDHADLSWFASRLGSGDARIAGEGAIAIQAQIGGPRVIHRITGTFLPLGTDLSLDNGRLQVRGITGGIRFSYGED